MPRLNDKLLDCAFYLFPDRQSAVEGKQVGGTGFFLAKGFPDPSLENSGVIFMVTNRHVVHTSGCSVARLTKHDGTPDYIELEPTDWIPHPGRHDLAATLGYFDQSLHKGAWVNASNLVSQHKLTEENIGIGDDVFMVGRFIGHDGKKTNVPAVRFGNISVMPSPIYNRALGHNEESFGVEMRSRPGFSGSPVLVYDFLSGLADRPEKRREGFLLCLGVEWGQIDERRNIRTRHDADHPEGHHVWEPTGLNGVVPAWYLTELLEVPQLKDRFDAIAEHQRQHLKNARAGAAPLVAPDVAEQDNSDHKEDFTRLLNEAAKKREPRD